MGCADIVHYITQILEDAKTLLVSYDSADHAKDCQTLLKRMKHEGASFATVTLPQLASGVLNYLEHGVSDYPGFKLQKGCEYPAFLRRLFAPIYNEETPLDEVAQNLNLIYQISVVCKKLKGPYPHRVLLKQAEDFVEVDRSLNNIDLESEHLQPILRHATAIVDSIFNGWDPDKDSHVLPNPGPGATNTKVEKHLRYEPWVLYKQIDDAMSYKEWFFAGPTGHHCVPARSYRSLFKSSKLLPTSRYCQVHKKIGEARGICIEENEMQWMQQAVKNGLYHRIENHPVTKGFVNFIKQSINKILALRASINRLKATIDMKGASDRVLRLLVAILFGNQPRLQEMLLALSTRVITFPPELGLDNLYTSKYAPMGSALCFPVMAIVHYALCKAIILESNVKDRFRKSKEVYVYGDDIIIDSSCTQAVYDWLPCFGMVINQSKSYHRSHFRESCGIHAYNGMDITPVFLKRIPNNTSGADTLLSALAAEGQFFSKGLFNTARLLRQRIIQFYGNMPFVNWKSSIAGFRRKGLHSVEHVLSYATKSRYARPDNNRIPWLISSAPDYQCQEHRLRVIVPKHEAQVQSPWMSEETKYLFKQVTSSREVSVPKSSPDDYQIRWRWLLDSALTTDVYECAN